MGQSQKIQESEKGRIVGQLDQISQVIGNIEGQLELMQASIKSLSDETKLSIGIVTAEVKGIREEQILEKSRGEAANKRLDKIEPTVEGVKFSVWAGGLIIAGVTVILNWGSSIRPWISGEHEPWTESRIEQPIDAAALQPDTDKDMAEINIP